MTINGLTLLLAFVAALAAIGWTVDYRRRVAAERRARIAENVAAEKGQRLLTALDERDAARRHADDAQWAISAIVADQHRERHPSALGAPSNVRVLRAVEVQA